MIFQIFSQNKYKRKEGKPLRETGKGGNMSGIVSSRSPNGRFCDLRRKRGLVQ